MATPPVTEGRTGATSGRRFFLQRTLGEGAFGSVYLAEMEGQGGFRRQVALKLLNANWDPESDAGRRLRDEARLLGRLQHRHIVRVDDLVQLEGRWALVMEYIGGADLEVVYTLCRSRGRLLPPRAVAEIGTAVAAALSAAWAAPGPDGQPLRVIHRDIKPSNVRLSETGDVKVLDFGVARAEFEGREAKTERVRYGSLGYMAPERLLGEPERPAGDVYALGVLLYELCTLDTYGRAELAPDKQAEQITRADAGLAERLDGSGEPGERLRALVRACLAYAGEDRPNPMDVEARLRALARALPGDDLQEFVATTFPAIGVHAPSGPDPIQGRVLEEHITNVMEAPRPFTTGGHTSPNRSGSVASGTLVLPDDGVEPLDAPPARSRAPLIAGGVGALALVALLGWFLSGGGSPAPDAPPPVEPAAAVAPPVPAPAAPAAPVAPPVVAGTEPAAPPVAATPTPSPASAPSAPPPPPPAPPPR